jgi:hypothetical protein
MLLLLRIQLNIHIFIDISSRSALAYPSAHQVGLLNFQQIYFSHCGCTVDLSALWLALKIQSLCLEDTIHLFHFHFAGCFSLLLRFNYGLLKICHHSLSLPPSGPHFTATAVETSKTARDPAAG